MALGTFQHDPSHRPRLAGERFVGPTVRGDRFWPSGWSRIGFCGLSRSRSPIIGDCSDDPEPCSCALRRRVDRTHAANRSRCGFGRRRLWRRPTGASRLGRYGMLAGGVPGPRAVAEEQGGAGQRLKGPVNDIARHPVSKGRSRGLSWNRSVARCFDGPLSPANVRPEHASRVSRPVDHRFVRRHDDLIRLKPTRDEYVVSNDVGKVVPTLPSEAADGDDALKRR